MKEQTDEVIPGKTEIPAGNSGRIRADLVVAVLAVAIGVCTMIVYIVQARIMSQQMHASVWPYLEMLTVPGEHGLKLIVSNKGAGPAIVKSTRIFMGGAEFRESQLDSVLLLLVAKIPSYVHTTMEGRVVSAGESFDFLHFPKMSEVVLLDSAFRKNDVRIETCYCSVFGDCWKVSRGKTTECDSCD